MKFCSVVFLLLSVACLSLATEKKKYTVSDDFVGHPLTCEGQCHKARSSSIHLASTLGLEFDSVFDNLRMASQLMAPSESLEIAHRELENANSGNKKDVIDHEKDEEEDQEEDDNKTRKDACRKADCKVLRDSLNCSTAGTYSKIGFVPLLSIKNMGYLFASVSSGISGLRPRFFSMEGAGGRTGYTIFVGSPYGAPTTVFAIMQPTRVGPAPEGPLKFLLEQALISSPARDRVPLKSKLIRFGKFEDSACTFKEDTPFRALPAGLVREVERDRMFSANDYFTLAFQTQTNITSVEVTIGQEQCAAVVLSTAPPCCVVSPEIPVSYGEGC